MEIRIPGRGPEDSIATGGAAASGGLPGRPQPLLRPTHGRVTGARHPLARVGGHPSRTAHGSDGPCVGPGRLGGAVELVSVPTLYTTGARATQQWSRPECAPGRAPRRPGGRRRTRGPRCCRAIPTEYFF